jgi:hypothetical protein
MMWSFCIEESERKDSSGLTFRRCFVRRVEDSCRRAVVLRESKNRFSPDKNSIRGRLTSLASIIEGVFLLEELEAHLYVSFHPPRSGRQNLGPHAVRVLLVN